MGLFFISLECKYTLAVLACSNVLNNRLIQVKSYKHFYLLANLLADK